MQSRPLISAELPSRSPMRQLGAYTIVISTFLSQTSRFAIGGIQATLASQREQHWPLARLALA